MPFGEQALRHFLYLERPEGINLADAEGFEALREAEPVMNPDDIVPRPQDFATVGELYRSIELGFERLVERYGEEWVFIGDESSQATPETFRWPELVPVTDLKSAKQAIDVVVEQGEGPRGHWKDAHYGRLLVILGEYLTMRKEDPAWQAWVLLHERMSELEAFLDRTAGEPGAPRPSRRWRRRSAV